FTASHFLPATALVLFVAAPVGLPDLACPNHSRLRGRSSTIVPATLDFVADGANTPRARRVRSSSPFNSSPGGISGKQNQNCIRSAKMLAFEFFCSRTIFCGVQSRRESR